MTERNDFDMYSNYDDKIPLRKKDRNTTEFGTEKQFKKAVSKNKESFADWVDKMTQKHNK